MKLNLNKPLAFFDLETTGINVTKDRIVEISILKVIQDGTELIKTWRVNPGMPIPDKSSKIHGIYDADVADKPVFAIVGKEVNQFLENCDLAGYNSNKFDVPLLVEEFLRANIDFDIKKRKLIDVQVIFFKKEPRTLGAAYRFYCQKELENAHTAEADVMATFEVLKAQLGKYEDLKNDINQISKFSSQINSADFAGMVLYNDQNQEIFNFGKHKGETVESIFEKEPGYYNWLINADFPLYTKKIFTTVKLRSSFGNMVK